MKIPKILSISIGLAFSLVALEPVHAAVFNCPAGDVDCLIDSINTANANGEDDTINLMAGTYTLTEVNNVNNNPNGLPSIISQVAIRGAGAKATIIERDNAAPEFAFFDVAGGAVLELDDMTLTGGIGNDGGAILNGGTVVLVNTIISGNRANDIVGGGIANFGIVGTSLTLINSTVSGNSAWGSGGGIYHNGEFLTVINSTVSDNVAEQGRGGGIFIPANQGSFRLINSTISNNTASEQGGGIFSFTSVMLSNSTITGNTAESGGGIFRGVPIPPILGPMELKNTIVGGNTDLLDNPDDCQSDDSETLLISLDYNLDSDGTCNLTQPNDLPNTDPLLGEFTDDGAPGQGHFPLLEGSPAIDKGDDAACLPTDQLGNPRVDGDGDSVIVCDIGAIEFQGANQPPEAICKDVTVPTEPGICRADASIDDGSFDPDGDPINLDQTPPGPYDLGETEVTLIVTDDKGLSDQCTATVTVVDQEAPVISSVSATPNKLWPPNHKMVPVVLAVDATDNCAQQPPCQITSVSSNEPVGKTAPDWKITGDLTVKLRAERFGKGHGRIYTIDVNCTDAYGNSSIATQKVTVPHDKGKKKRKK